MATRNAYLAYKRDTNHLLYWMVHASNAIEASVQANGDAPSRLNTTGQISVSDLVAIARRIAEKSKSVPSTIYALFQSVIDARTNSYAFFKQLNEGQADPETLKSNESHKHFINVLTQAFEALGGKDWMARKDADKQNMQDAETLEDVVFSNAFASLSLDTSNDVEDATDASDAEGEQSSRPAPNIPRRHKRTSGKGKKKRRAKDRSKPKSSPEAENVLDSVPLESYRIIQDEDGIVTEYLFALYSFLREWISLRSYVQGLWRDVAYEGLNGATAATLSNIAITMIQRTAAAIFVEFPDHDAYGTILDIR